MTNPCFLKKTVCNILGDTLIHPQKTWICEENFILPDGITELVYTNFVSFFVLHEMRSVSQVGFIQICEKKYKMQANVTNMAADSRSLQIRCKKLFLNKCK